MTMPPDWMPGAVRKPIPYRTAAGKFTKRPLGWILHVVVGNGSPYGTFAGAVSPNRRFSHFWVAKSGRIEQYAETSCQSWAQQSGNPLYWSVETEGFPTEGLSLAQIASLAQIHNFLGVANSIAHVPGDKGIGTHYMGGAAWGGHTCPDPNPPGRGPRSLQRADILHAANPPHPTPTPPPPPVRKGKPVFAVSLKSSSAIYVSDGIYRRWIPALPYYDFLVAQGMQHPADKSAFEFDTVAGMNAAAGPLAPGTADAPPAAPAKAHLEGH